MESKEIESPYHKQKAFCNHLKDFIVWGYSHFLVNDIVQSFFSIEMLTTKILSLTLVSIEVISINENYRAVRQIDLWESLKNLFARAKEVTQEFKNINEKDK